MQRVMILGGPGSGKSTLARWLGARTGLPVQHMDHIHWQPGWVERDRASKIAMIEAVEATEHWIIEGGLSATYAARMARADMIVWLDLPVGLRLWRILRRSWRYRGRSRPDLPQGCPEQLNRQTAEFLRWTWDHRHTSRLKIAQTLAQQQVETPLFHLQTTAAVRAFQRKFDAITMRDQGGR